jgi:hypothetical protein
MICLIDKEPSDSAWEFRRAEYEADPCRHARRQKIMGYDLSDVTVWIDGAIKLEQAMTPEKCDELLGDADIALYRHNKRKCIFSEAQACIDFDKDDPKVITKQMDRYRDEGMPKNFGLVATGILIRRNTPAMKDFSEMWWDEVKNGSNRDQLSFDYCRWKTGLRVSYLNGSIYSSDIVTCHYHDGRGVIR